MTEPNLPSNLSCSKHLKVGSLDSNSDLDNMQLTTCTTQETEAQNYSTCAHYVFKTGRALHPQDTIYTFPVSI